MNAALEVPFNAVCQAVKRLVPGISRDAHRSVCGYPNCVTATNRYWRETYNIRPWEKRPKEERSEALGRAQLLVAESIDRGVRCKKLERMIRSGEIAKPNDVQLAIAGYHYHHSAMRRGYCPVDLIGSVKCYSGHFGHGVIRRLGKGGRYGNSTQYESISYWVK